MKVGFWLGSGSLEGGGTTPYAYRVLNALSPRLGSEDIQLVILCSAQVYKECQELFQKYRPLIETCIIPDYLKSKSLLNRLIGRIMLKLGLIQLEQMDPWFYWFNQLDIDLLHIPYQVTPYYDLRYPFIVTMHDVQELHYPEFFTPQERAVRANLNWKSLEQSKAVIVSFQHVKDDLIKYFRLENEKIKICPLPYSEIILSTPNREEEMAYREKYDNWKDFLLYPAQTWEHKNHLSLMRALELVHEKSGKSIHLICTGKKNPGFFPKIENYLNTSIISEFVHFTDIVPETELFWLYKNCSLVVIPTLYEAGSFPLLEAMSLQVPVICSSITSLPETIGDSRFIFDPFDVEKTSDLILKMMTDPEICHKNIQNSKQKISKLIQIDSSKYFFELWKSIIKKSSTSN
jgi:glycosyltransferase involved in cell wall biosynthesis